MKVVAVGGTGLIGSKLVINLKALGHEAVAAAPNTGVNTLTGEGLAQVLKGAQVVVDVSNSPAWEEKAVMEFFNTSTRNLLTYGVQAGVKHLVALSVVGTHRLSQRPYFCTKIGLDTLVKESTLLYSIVLATQFFEFVNGIAASSTQGSEVRLAPVLIQTMAADDVAKGVARVSRGTPVNGTVEIAGPEKFRLDELIRIALRAMNDPREVVADPDRKSVV